MCTHVFSFEQFWREIQPSINGPSMLQQCRQPFPKFFSSKHWQRASRTTYNLLSRCQDVKESPGIVPQNASMTSRGLHNERGKNNSCAGGAPAAYCLSFSCWVNKDAAYKHQPNYTDCTSSCPFRHGAIIGVSSPQGRSKQLSTTLMLCSSLLGGRRYRGKNIIKVVRYQAHVPGSANIKERRILNLLLFQVFHLLYSTQMNSFRGTGWFELGENCEYAKKRNFSTSSTMSFPLTNAETEFAYFNRL
eukprot:284817682_5